MNIRKNRMSEKSRNIIKTICFSCFEPDLGNQLITLSLFKHDTYKLNTLKTCELTDPFHGHQEVTFSC